MSLTRLITHCLIACLLVLGLWTAAFAQQDGEVASIPALSEGERLVYAVSWGFIPAGEAVFEIMPARQADGEAVYEVRLQGYTSGLFDAIFPMEVSMLAVLDRALRRTLDFQKDQNGHETRIVFDWHSRTARYVRDGEALDPIELPGDALDPLGLAIAARLRSLEVGAGMRTTFTNGKYALEGVARVLRHETVETEAGVFQAAVIQPDLEGVGGYFSRSRDPRLTVWISRDERRLPVRITSKLMLGHIIGELVAIEVP